MNREHHVWVIACALIIVALAGWLWLLPGGAGDDAAARESIEADYQHCLYLVATNTDVSAATSDWLANRCQARHDQALADLGR